MKKLTVDEFHFLNSINVIPIYSLPDLMDLNEYPDIITFLQSVEMGIKKFISSINFNADLFKESLFISLLHINKNNKVTVNIEISVFSLNTILHSYFIEALLYRIYGWPIKIQHVTILNANKYMYKYIEEKIK